jgi:hypothetical protein
MGSRQSRSNSLLRHLPRKLHRWAVRVIDVLVVGHTQAGADSSTISGTAAREDTEHWCVSHSCVRANVKRSNVRDWKGNLSIVGTVLAFHLGALSFVFGPGRIDYALTAYCSAVFVWGIASLFRGRRPVGIWITAMVVTVVIQQVAYRTMACEGSGFWWPLIQFFALHFVLVRAARTMLDLNEVSISGGPRMNVPM